MEPRFRALECHDFDPRLETMAATHFSSQAVVPRILTQFGDAIPRYPTLVTIRIPG